MRTITTILILTLVACKTVNIPESFVFVPGQLGDIKTFDNLTEINLTKNDLTTLNCLHLNNSTSETVILYLHGNAGNIWTKGIFDFYQLIDSIGFDLFAVDYQGYGKSSGKPSINSLYQDAELAYSHLTKTYDKGQIIIWGQSLGSIPACRLASQGKGGKLILEAAFTNLDDMAAHMKKRIKAPKRWLLKLTFDDNLQFDQLSDIKKVKYSVLIIHGENDQTAPFELAQKLYDNVTNEKKELYKVDGAGHNDTDKDRATYCKRITEFIKKE